METSSCTDLWDYAGLDAAECDDIADLLRSLDPAAWGAPSLCESWLVRDVIGHIISIGEVNLFTTPFSVIRHGFFVDIWLERSAIRRAQGRSRGELISAWDRHRPGTGLERVRPQSAMLYEHFVHHQDIRRPLGLTRSFRPSVLLALLDLAPRWGGRIRSKQRAAGLRLDATDVDWSHGEGPLIRGSAEAILLVLAGRHRVIDELEGDGLGALRTRR